MNIYCSKLKYYANQFKRFNMILSNSKRIENLTKRGWWGEDTLYSLFQDALISCRDQEALIDPDNRVDLTGDMPKRLSFDELERQDLSTGIVATSGAAGAGTAILIERI